jgi:hypothetical protein
MKKYKLQEERQKKIHDLLHYKQEKMQETRKNNKKQNKTAHQRAKTLADS